MAEEKQAQVKKSASWDKLPRVGPKAALQLQLLWTALHEVGLPPAVPNDKGLARRLS